MKLKDYCPLMKAKPKRLHSFPPVCWKFVEEN